MPLHQTPFYYIRHGQSESNRDRIMAGAGIDSPLTDLGRQQAMAAGLIMAKLSHVPTAICYSPMKRAAETAHIINESLGVPMTAIPDLREHFVGDWEGRPWAEVTKFWDEGIMDPPNGEPWGDFQIRVKHAMNECLATAGPVLVVAHGGVWQAIKMLYAADNGQFELDNAVPHHFHPIPDRALYPWRVQKLTLCAVSGDLLRQDIAAL